MFTGLVEAMGTISGIRDGASGRRLAIRAPEVFGSVGLGESVAINGCCLTVVDPGAGSGVAEFDAGPETLSRTNLGRLAKGDRVNLERALLANARLGGHIVQGHVDALATVQRRVPSGPWETFWFDAGAWTRQMVPKGSVAVDGVSLTLVDVQHDSFSVALIPHTLAVTTLGTKRPGDAVNLETDILGKYVLKYLAQMGGGLSAQRLGSAGFLG